MQGRIKEILKFPDVDVQGEEIGCSRGGLPIQAFRFGTGPLRVSLLAGCHADEPVGPRLLKRLCAYLFSLSSVDPLLQNYEWWIVPHINPDGQQRNRVWQVEDADRYDLIDYLSYRVRELPGDDIEFGFPKDADDEGARPENRAAFDWWRRADGPFGMHMSLHGMGFARGPWFLIEAAWKDHCKELKKCCVTRVDELGHTLHDVERNGEKGFFRLGRGFCTRPDSRFMREHFVGLGDEGTAKLFRPSSMETIRSFGGNPLTLVSEMPLFVTPGVGDTLGPPDPVADSWKDQIEDWSIQLQDGRHGNEILAAASAKGLLAMPVRDQMILQWSFLVAGLEQVELNGPRTP